MISITSSLKPTCRLCGHRDLRSVVDLGTSPLCENYLTADQTQQPEVHYPLHALVCRNCLLVQVEEHVSGTEIFGGDYAYFSSFSSTWLEHCRQFVDQIVDRCRLTSTSFVVELASNDGYLLRNVVERGIPCLGVEPAANVAAAAIDRGVPTRVAFFGEEEARSICREHGSADLIVANNVLAHVPNVHDFVAGIKTLLAADGCVSIEFPHIMSLIEGNQFDTIYQEHYCYFSLHSCEALLALHELQVFDIEHLSTHGGSYRIYAGHADQTRSATPALEAARRTEAEKGYDHLERYLDFGPRVTTIKRHLLEFLIRLKEAGKSIAGYGAPGKGNTLLNYCGIRSDFLDFTVDRNEFKHGKFLPGSHIPVLPVDVLRQERPDYVLILPWNLKDEIAQQISYVNDWGGKLFVAIPTLEVIEPRS